MPPSTPSAETRWRAALAVGGLAVCATLALGVGRVVWFDAYWVYRERPPWLAVTGGASRILDRQTRRAKVLQALVRPYSVALLGSSTVYHGLDPRDVAPRLRGEVYNAGISALVADELPLVASVVASRSRLRQVVLGLDYYMFSRRDPLPVQLSPSLRDAAGRWEARLGAAISRYAITDSFIDRVARGAEPGAWTREGFRITPKLRPDQTRQNDAARRRLTAPYRPETLEPLRQALHAFAHVRVTLYLSPVSEAQRRILAERGLLDDFSRWRADMAGVAAEHGATFIDLADRGAADPFNPDSGSTDVWLDNLHYTPVLGREVLNAVGLRSPGQAD
ncbi:SGNH/GDSL hydrolase family protein [Enterovirga sp.]|uniref:SGNH/GDSL hydrolase family protein n=1 Tax=Enterovirga sp. TaxID=2026350 RepID=UPI00261BCD98|nr:SGNH/GDSL hydrolase family protein [Enterovirga sp.]MDB5591244.1 hypothetical protein [Enterovirga sp.]